MIHHPYKKVGAPASFKGVRGDYLNSLFIYAGSALFLSLLIFIIPLPTVLRFILLALVFVLFRFWKYPELKKLSKGKDLFKETKRYARKNVIVYSNPLKSSNYVKKDKH